MNFQNSSCSQATKRHFFVWFSIAVVLIGFGAAFAAGILIGQHQGRLAVVPEGEKQVVNKWSFEATSKNLDFDQFWGVWNLVKESYYQQPVSDEDLFYGALKGILTGLEDPYSVFFDPEEAQMFLGDLDGSFEGIGAQIDADETGQIVVVAPLPDTPAMLAGLLSGDKILAIDGEDTFGFSVEEAVAKIRGPKGTTVVLTITRNGWTSASDFSIVRDTIIVESVKFEMRDDGLAVISMYMFNDEAKTSFTSAVNSLLTQGAEGIILDLRGNPGGLLNIAIDVASVWTGQEPVVVQSMRGEQQVFVGSTVARLSGLPTVVLVDGGSASASEIVAGALQDYGLAKLVGTQTFGKGSVQDYQELADGSAVKITIAEWLTPNGRSIHHIGIIPDFVVEYTQADAEAKRDPQMEKAVDLLINGYAVE